MEFSYTPIAASNDVAGAFRTENSALPARATLQLSVVIPCYNEQEVLHELHRRLMPVCAAVAGAAYEVILIDDGSRDTTWGLIAALAQTDSRIVGVRLSRNHGHQLALSAGLALALGERILVLDADLQDPPELLPDMLKLMEQEAAEVVYGRRGERLGETWFKRKSSAAFYRLLSRLAETPIPQDAGDFRLMTRRVVTLLNDMPEQYRFIRGLVSWVGFKQIPFVYQRKERFAGVTKYPLRKMLRFAIDAITSFSIRPLRLAGMLGMAVAAVGVCALIYAVFRLVRGETVPGWTSIVVATSLFSSVQLIVLGIMGEYLGRLYIESKRRPMFIIDQVIRHPQA
jgi:glycosyltransferase involved in cell wall biosynthesis